MDRTTAINRRQWMLCSTTAAAVAAASTACSTLQRNGGPAIPNPARVSILRHAAYDQNLFAAIRRLILDYKLDVKGKKVVLKPNMVEFDAGTTINTNPLFVHAVLEAFRSLDAASVTIAEGPGHRRITMDLAEEAGYFRQIPGFDGLFTDLNLDATSERAIVKPVSSLKSLHLPQTALGADLLVSLPKLKTHHWVGATLSMKNLFGLVPGGVYGWPKNVLHWAGISESIADLYHLFPNTFAIVDGIDGMEGNGPIQGTPKHAGVIVAGTNMISVDATCCRIMGIDPQRIDYFEFADKRRIAENAMVQTGETVDSVRTDFALLPQFAHMRLAKTRKS